MTREKLIASAVKYIKNAPGNRISKEIAISEDVVGLQIYEDPIFAFGDANDVFFAKLREPEAIGEHFILPAEWLPGANTVVSFFLPFTERVKTSNAQDYEWPSNEWLHARIEGQQLLTQLLEFLKGKIESAKHQCVVPILDPRFQAQSFTSNWSERHIAYVCGLGTFGLSKGLITEKGMAGRFGSLVTDADFPKDTRAYSKIYGYCISCGACARHCPVRAISSKDGKKHPPCSDFIDSVLEKHRPRYGCGKCQVNVPCESKNPYFVKI